VRVRESDYKAVNLLRRVRGIGDRSYTLQQTARATDAAKLGSDFLLPASYLDPRDQSAVLSVRIINDTLFEADETVRIFLEVDGDLKAYYLTIEDDDLFIPAAGRLSGTVLYSGGTRSAQLIATVAATGAVTGKLNLLGLSLPFTTKLDQRGKALVLLTPKGRASMHLTLQALDSQGGFRISLLDAADLVSRDTELTLATYSTLNPCPENGLFTVNAGLVPGSSATVTSTGSLSVNTAGVAVMVGRLFDGRPYTATGFVDGTGLLSVLAAPTGGGQVGLSGDLPLLHGQEVDLAWVLNRPARAGVVNKHGAMAGEGVAQVARYTKPDVGERVLDRWNAGNLTVYLNNGPVQTVITKACTITAANVVIPPVDSVKLKVTFVPSNGTFVGSFVLPNSTVTLPFYGIVRDLPGAAGFAVGHFFDGNTAGRVFMN
jgi:hypothetical protein